jgi:hypothetical protein
MSCKAFDAKGFRFETSQHLDFSPIQKVIEPVEDDKSSVFIRIQLSNPDLSNSQGNASYQIFLKGEV